MLAVYNQNFTWILHSNDTFKKFDCINNTFGYYRLLDTIYYLTSDISEEESSYTDEIAPTQESPTIVVEIQGTESQPSLQQSVAESVRMSEPPIPHLASAELQIIPIEPESIRFESKLGVFQSKTAPKELQCTTEPTEPQSASPVPAALQPAPVDREQVQRTEQVLPPIDGIDHFSNNHQF